MRSLSLVVICLVASTAFAGSKVFTLADLFLKPVLKMSFPVQLQWAADGQSLLLQEEKRIVQLAAPALTRTVLVESAALVLPGETKPVAWDYFFPSPDGRSLLLTGALRARGVKAGGAVYHYELGSKRLRRLALEKDAVSLVQFAPDSKRIGYVRAHDLYVLDLESGRETRLTTGGSDVLLHGEPDWAYEEEFGAVTGWSWSPDGRRIAFWEIDQAKVPRYPLLDYTKPHPDIAWMRYPKAGDPNPQARVGVVSVESAQVRWIDVGFRSDHYVPRFQWAPDSGTLLVQVLDRRQSRLDLLAVSLENGAARTLLTEKESTWVDVHDDLFFFPDGTSFTWTSERSGFRHLYRVGLADGKTEPLTAGPWEVLSVAGVAANGGRVLFTATKDGAAERPTYAVDVRSRVVSRLTGTGVHAPMLSPDRRHFVDTTSSFERLPQVLLARADGGEVGAIAKNEGKELGDYAMGRAELFSFETSEGVRLDGLLLKPADFDPKRKYKALLAPYGGPGSRQVLNRWQSLWYHYLAQHGFVVAVVDNRGTGSRGKAFASQVYRRLGELESRDQIETGRWLAAQPWVDAGKIAMWGWSYGGYLTALTVARGGDLFKAGISVAPVSHWGYYDSIYTERFMGLPSDNPEGYRNSSPITHAKELTASLFVVHGTGDDNVHYQNSMSLVDALVAENKDVLTMLYPYRTHGISEGRYTTYRLYQRFTDFLNTRLDGPPPPEDARR